ncbi:FtsX-like permease family protein [Fusibacter bizertensis]
MYVKLALSNARRSIKDYIIYFVTLIICVSLFYGFLSLSSAHSDLINEDSYNFEFLKLMMKYSTYIVTGMLIFLIGYVNKYMIKRRKREFASYILLGIPQRNVAFMFFIETLIMGMISIVIGVIVGTLFSQLVTALILMTVKQEIVFSFKLYWDTVCITFLFFTSMYCIIGSFNVRTLSKAKLIQLLSDGKKSEFQFKRGKFVYLIVFVIAILLYIACVYFVHNILQAINNHEIVQGNETYYFPLAIGSFIIGTYALFYALSYILIIIKEKWINFKYTYTNLFLVGTVVSKIKTAPVLIATISLTFLGAALCFTLTLLLSQWSLGYLDNRIPFDTIVAGKLNIMQSEASISEIDYSGLVEYLSRENYHFDDYCEVEQYYIYDKAQYENHGKDMPLFAIGLSDYNYLRSMLGLGLVELESDTFTTQWMKIVDEKFISEYITENTTLRLKDKALQLNEKAYYKASIGEYIYKSYDEGLIILPDAWCKNLTLASKDFYANSDMKISNAASIKLEGELIPNWFEENYGKLLNGEKKNPLIVRLKAAETNIVLNATLGMRILGIYGGAVLLMISLTVLALQQLSDSIEHKERYIVLKKLGIDPKEINRIILKQISLYYTIPILVAVFGFYIFFNAFKIASKSITAAYIGDQAFMFNITISLMIIIIIYFCYFITTFYSFKRNVENE